MLENKLLSYQNFPKSANRNVTNLTSNSTCIYPYKFFMFLELGIYISTFQITDKYISFQDSLVIYGLLALLG